MSTWLLVAVGRARPNQRTLRRRRAQQPEDPSLPRPQSFRSTPMLRILDRDSYQSSTRDACSIKSRRAKGRKELESALFQDDSFGGSPRSEPAAPFRPSHLHPLTLPSSAHLLQAARRWPPHTVLQPSAATPAQPRLLQLHQARPTVRLRRRAGPSLRTAWSNSSRAQGR